MNFVITSDLPIKALRVIASKKREEEKKEFYKSISSKIHHEFVKLSMIELYRMIHKETDTCFLELECEMLTKKLIAYDGSITLEFLDDFFSICSISDIWRLMLEANSSIIQSVAKDKLDEILKEYDNEEDIKSKQIEKRKFK
ncbi:MAG: hypothetical protein HFH31_02310 [Bacilli bacterium]|nr:hypothetical protein [Bacilli bacterium]